MDVTEPIAVTWTSYTEENGTLTLSWSSSGGKSNHIFILERSTLESDWVPEDGVSYSAGYNDNLKYCGSDTFYTDDSLSVGETYYYRLFAADNSLSYSSPIGLTISLKSNGLSAVEAPILRHISQKSYYIDLGWTQPGGNCSGFIILKSQIPITWRPDNGTSYTNGEAVSGASVVWTGTDNYFSDTEVSKGHEYYYKIFAYNDGYLYSSGLHCQLLFETESNLEYDRIPWVDNYMIYYGPLNSTAINTAKKYDLVIIHPSNNGITRDQVRQIQRGFDAGDPSDDVLVVAYVAVGEDLRTISFYPVGAIQPDYDAMLLDDRFVRNGIGPRVDPRGAKPNGGILSYNYSIGSMSQGGSGFASYYLDDNDVVNGVNGGKGDGLPDFNESWRGAFVNAGDPLWFQEVDQMRFAKDKVYGLQELLTTSAGEGLGVDGIFMDAMDTFAPNNWTDQTSPVQTEFEWTAPGFSDFIKRMKDKYPDKIVIQNRAVFLFRPGFPQQYLKYSSRHYIDFLVFESFRLNSSSSENYNSMYYQDNLNNYAPPILAEAGREDGFQVLSLGYAEGVTVNESDLDSESYNTELIEDIRVTQNIGFRHYLTNRYVDNPNSYVLDKGDWSDTEAPVWSSVYNQVLSTSPTPRYGLLKAEAVGGGTIRVFWDIALDKYSVDYYLYFDTSPLDFSGNSKLDGIQRVTLHPRIPEDYQSLSTAMTNSLYPFYDDAEGFTSGRTYYLCIRAVDRSPAGNMDSNTSSLYLMAK